ISSRLLRLEPTGFSARAIFAEGLQIKNVGDISLLRAGSRAGGHEEIERAGNALVDQKASPRFVASSPASSDHDLRMRITLAEGKCVARSTGETRHAPPRAGHPRLCVNKARKT